MSVPEATRDGTRPSLTLFPLVEQVEQDRWDERAGVLSAAVSSLVRLAHSDFRVQKEGREGQPG